MSRKKAYSSLYTRNNIDLIGRDFGSLLYGFHVETQISCEHIELTAIDIFFIDDAQQRFIRSASLDKQIFVTLVA